MVYIARRQLLGSLFPASCLGAIAVAQDTQSRPTTNALYPRTIVLVRHAERASGPQEDPKLTAAGAARSQRLAATLGASGVTHLFATELQRTQSTLAPLAARTRVTPRIVPARDGAALLKALAVLPRGAVAVVAGHSNTVPSLLGELTGGGAKRVTIAEEEHDRLFVVTQWGAGAEALALELRY